MNPTAKKTLKIASLVVAAIISLFLFAALWKFYKRAEKKKLEKTKKALEEKWIKNKNVLGVGTILGATIEITVKDEATKKEVEKTLMKDHFDGVPVTVIIRDKVIAQKDTDKKEEQKA